MILSVAQKKVKQTQKCTATSQYETLKNKNKTKQ